MGAEQIIGGRYRLDARLGAGTMGAVWRARDLETGADVAVKVTAGHLAPGERLRTRFEREARAARTVEHENVVRVLDSGIDGEQPYVVMELLEGEDLDARLSREPRPSVAEIVEVAAAALDGLAACHDAGVIHRDLKPDNVFLTTIDGRTVPKIVDFGVAKLVATESGTASLTRSGEIVGTPIYMAPEQTASSKSASPQSDLYSVGVVLYEALTGREPYEWENLGQLLLAIALETPTPVVEVRPEVGAALSDVVARAMAKEPADRFESARAMRDALLACRGDALTSVPAAQTSLRSGRRAAPREGSSPPPPPPPSGSDGALFLGLGVAVVLALIAAAYAWIS